MSFLLCAAATCIAGLALLHLVGLATRRRAIDAPLAWFAGSGWFALFCFACRFGGGIPFSWPLATVAFAVPPAAWLALRLRGGARSNGEDAAPGPGVPARPISRWIPRPIWLWLLVAAYVAVVLAAVLLHGFDTPTNTDDGVRLRALTPMLAFADEWSPEARGLLGMAGAVPTFVPAAAWLFTRSVDAFHVNYVVLTDLVALLVLAVGLASTRGTPERGWASALGLLSIPLFVYHCTSTYQDAVLAMYVGAAFLFAMEHGRTGEPRDLGRALLVAVAAGMVKREGELVAATVVAALLAYAAWRRARGASIPLGRLALLVAVPATALLLAKTAAFGLADASAMTRLLATRVEATAAAGPAAASAGLRREALEAFVYALFRSGNAGGIYWALAATVIFAARAAARSTGVAPLALLALLLGEVAASSIWLFPEFTLDQTTVHRALLVVTVPAALWLAAALVDTAWPESRPAPP
ncbi:MAG TPA: hypothetical protein VIV57_26570 [Anaeromyxobacter sp.]